MAKNQKGILSQRKGWDRAKRHGVADRERIDEKEKINAPGVFPSGLVSLFSATLSTPCWLEGPGVSASWCPLSPVCVVRHALTGLCVQVQSCQRRLNKWLHVFLYVLCVCFWGFFCVFACCIQTSGDVFPTLLCLLSFYMWFLSVHCVPSSLAVRCWVSVCDYRCVEKSSRVPIHQPLPQPSDTELRGPSGRLDAWGVAQREMRWSSGLTVCSVAEGMTCRRSKEIKHTHTQRK